VLKTPPYRVGLPAYRPPWGEPVGATGGARASAGKPARSHPRCSGCESSPPDEVLGDLRNVIRTQSLYEAWGGSRSTDLGERARKR
jgi:hypothetical protein